MGRNRQHLRQEEIGFPRNGFNERHFESRLREKKYGSPNSSLSLGSSPEPCARVLSSLSSSCPAVVLLLPVGRTGKPCGLPLSS